MTHFFSHTYIQQYWTLLKRVLLLFFMAVFVLSVMSSRTNASFMVTVSIDGNTVTTGVWYDDTFETIVVQEEDLADDLGEVLAEPTSWFFYNDWNGSDGPEGIDSDLGSFVSGPAIAPMGEGSAEISVSGDKRRNLATYQFAGTKLADIETMQFDTYNASASNGGAASRSAYINFNVDFNYPSYATPDSWQYRLYFVPSQNGTVVQDSWQTHDAVASGTALWGWSRYAANGNQWPDGNTNPLRTWNDLLTAFPDIAVRTSDSWFGMRVGEPYADGYTENIDAFVIGIDTGPNVHTTTFDFEPTDTPQPEPLPIEAYAVFGASDVSTDHQTETGTNVTIIDGFIGSNRSIDIGGGTNALGIRAGGDVDTGTNVIVGSEGVIADEAVWLGGGTAVNGDVHGESLSTGTNVDTYADVIVTEEVSFGGSTQAHANVDALDATLATNAQILGTLTLPLGETPTLGGGASVAILINDGTPRSTPETFTPVTLPDANVFAANDTDYSVSGGGSLTLPPGIYGELETGTNVTLNFSSGTYVFKNFDIGGGTDVNLDLSGGDILFFVVEDIETGTNIDSNLIGGTAEDVYWEAGGTVSLGGGTDWYGTVYSTKHNKPDEEGVTTGTNVNVWGALYSAEQVRVGGGSTVTLVGPFFGSYTGPAPTLATDVVLNEIYPRPYSASVEPVAPYDREWVEVYNSSAVSADVLGFTVKVGATSHVIEATCSGDANRMQPYNGDTIVAPGELLVLEFCNNGANNKLANGGTTVELLDSVLTSLDSHTYPNTAEGKSHQRIPDGGIWIDPDPTPGEPNRVSRQDLIDAGFTEEMIAQIIAMLAARGETLVGEEVVETTIVEDESHSGGSNPSLIEDADVPANKPDETTEGAEEEVEDDEDESVVEEAEEATAVVTEPTEVVEEPAVNDGEGEDLTEPETVEDDEAEVEPEEPKVEEEEPQPAPEETTNEATI